MPRLAIATLLMWCAADAAFAAGASVSAKVYVEYKKAVLTLSPTKAALAAAKEQGLEDPRAVTFQPNVVPSVGGGLEVYGLALSYSMSIPQSRAQREARGETKATHSEVHVSRWKWVTLDARRELYEGFFRREIEIGATDPLGDSLFHQDQRYDQLPAMRLTWMGGSALFAFRPDSFALNQAVSSSATKRHSGWSPVMLVNANRIILENAETLIPDEQTAYFGDDAALTGGTFYDAGVLPGVGFTLVGDSFYLTPIAACGFTWQAQEFTGIDRKRVSMRGSACDLRGSAGMTTKSASLGVLGYKTIQTITAETVNVSPASSSVQLFLSVQL